MTNTIEKTTLKHNLCIGCGICSSTCPYDAINMDWTRYKEFKPIINHKKCTKCGICNEYCPNSREKIQLEANKIINSYDPNSFGLKDAKYLLAHDKDTENRKKSASGGFITAFIKHLFDKKLIDGVIHGEMIDGKIGEAHYKSSISINYYESDKKRSSFYAPICYLDVLKYLKKNKGTYLVIGVPCVIRGLTTLFNEHNMYKNNTIYTIALACSHNVNGQFIDFLSESLNIDKEDSFKVNLRNKDGIKDANNYNNHFFNTKGDIIKINRFKSIFTDTWRNYFFAMNVCHYCSDFWGYTADISVKDAWGKWANNPLGDSIVVVRNKMLLEEIIKSSYLEHEYLDFDTVSKSQLDTTMYKQYKIKNRLSSSFLSLENIKSGFCKYYIFSRLSKWCYKKYGYKISKGILFSLLRIANNIDEVLNNKTNINLDYERMKNEIIIKKMQDKRVFFFGTGEMSKILTKGLPIKVAYYLDNDVSKQEKSFCNSVIKNPEFILDQDKEKVFIVVTSIYYNEISQQLKNMGFSEELHFIDGNPLYEKIMREKEVGKQKSIKYKTLKKLKSLSILVKPILSIIDKLFLYKKEKKYKKILVVGGYGFKNTGDEAQLSATLDMLYDEFPEYMIKVLTPNKGYTYFEHDRCLVGDAPRTAFYDLGETTLYSLNSKWNKIKFIIISFWIYLNAFLVRANLPTLFINSKKVSLLHEIYTSDLIYFSGGGYLTGRTTSRLWDGMFLIGIADIFGVPSALSGQTIGVWNNKFNKMLGKWGLSKAKIITLRDPEESIKALEEIGIIGERVFTTFDDALFCEKIEEKDSLYNILMNSGLSLESIMQGYIVVNIHYWGLKTYSQKELLLNKINLIINRVLKEININILLIPMTPSDEETINDYNLKYKNEKVYSLIYDYNFRKIRSIIGGAEICITMKHHPIIFAVGEKVPVISLSMGDYYNHKNIGALKIFGLERYNVIFDKDDYINEFDMVLKDVLINKDMLTKHIDNESLSLRKKKDKFIRLVKSVVLNENNT